MVAQSSSLNVVGVSPLHGLLGVGGVEVRPKKRDHTPLLVGFEPTLSHFH
jgi:hypothetical protein